MSARAALITGGTSGIGKATAETEPARLIAYVIADDGAEPTVYDK
jgi:NAD(P)-dependent dehydrogenase (short-subunit alcohol dehydrogenase family)